MSFPRAQFGSMVWTVELSVTVSVGLQSLVVMLQSWVAAALMLCLCALSLVCPLQILFLSFIEVLHLALVSGQPQHCGDFTTTHQKTLRIVVVFVSNARPGYDVQPQSCNQLWRIFGISLLDSRDFKHFCFSSSCCTCIRIPEPLTCVGDFSLSPCMAVCCILQH